MEIKKKISSGLKTYHIITYGCQANLADSERIEGKLKSLGYAKAEQEEDADLIVLNGCSVRKSAIDRLYSKINQFSLPRPAGQGKKKIILAGCILDSDKKKLRDKIDEIWHPDEYFDLKPVYSSPHSAYVPIMTGCDNFCSYCAVPYTRGRERSRPAKEIIEEIEELVKNGYKEIWLLGQTVNSYREGEMTFSLLLREVNAIHGDFKIYFMSSHPKDFSDDLIKTISQCEKVSKEIHLAVQSGDNEILKRMNRNYTIEEYGQLIAKIREAIPEAKISTDVIVGFPGETEEQFQNTVRFFKETAFEKAYVCKYSSRPGTLAAKTMKDDVSVEEKKRRWEIINKIANEK